MNAFRYAALVFAAATPLSVCAQDEKEETREPTPEILQQRGTEHFFAGRIKESLADWNRVVELLPERLPYHWQRGIALYYAGRYADGVKQFESHQTVNARDVENAVWHFLCAVRAPGGSVEKARENIYPYAGDQRVPMKEVHALFAGDAKPADVLAAAKKDVTSPDRLRNNLCYAHLYLGLYFEALGKTQKSAKHMKKAAVEYKMDHYMGKVAQIHHKLRNKEREASE